MMSWERRVKAVAVLLLTLAAYPTHGGKFTSCGDEIEDLSTGIIYTAPQAFYGGAGEIIYQ